jgi:DNA-binding HxlR family transcriptional regulator
VIAIPPPPIRSARIGLRLLRPELCRAILIDALATRPMGVGDLCGRLMLESDTTLREQLNELEGVGAIEKRQSDGASADEFRLTVVGEDLIEAMVLAGRWLTSRPGRPLRPESDAGRRAFAALADGWEATLIHHLLLRPSTKAQLQRTTLLSKEKLKRMLRRLQGAGLLGLMEPDARAPRYAVTIWARRAIGVLVAIGHWERAHLRETAEPVAASDGVVGLLASLPLIRPPVDADGICAFTVEVDDGEPGRRSGAVWARLTGGRVTACRGGVPPTPPDAWVHGGVDDWCEAVINARPSALHLGGDRTLVASAIHGLHQELFTTPATSH